MRVGIMMHQVLGHCVDDCPGNLRATGPIEVRHMMTLMNAFERGESRADLVDGCDGKPRRLIGGNGHGITFDSAVVRVQSARLSGAGWHPPVVSARMIA